MGWLSYRVAAIVLAVLAGGGLGYLVGESAQAPVLGVLLGVRWRRRRSLRSMAGAATRSCPGCAGRRTRLRRATRASGASSATASNARSASASASVTQEQTRLSQFLSAIEASPNGVLLLDAGDQIEWCNSLAAEHFGLDPRARPPAARHQSRARAGVRDLPARRAMRTRRWSCQPRSGRGTLSVLVRRYGEGHEARAVAGHHASASAPRRCGATSSPTSRTRSARR